MKRLASRSLALGFVAMTLLTGSAAASAQALALQPIVARMVKAMTAATAYKVVIESTISGGGALMGGGATMTHMEMIRVHHGTTTQLYVLMVSKPAKGAMSTSETVMSGTRGCTRQGRTGAWTCHYSPAAFSALANADPTKAMQEAGIRFALSPTGGSRTIQGQTCAVYTFTESMAAGATITLHGTWFLNATTALPVEVDAIGSEALTQGQPPFAIRSKTSYSRWNDPTLTVPAVPGM